MSYANKAVGMPTVLERAVPGRRAARAGRPIWGGRSWLLATTLLATGLLELTAAGGAQAQTFGGTEQTGGPFSSGTQTFNDSSQLNASAPDTVTGGTQTFNGSSQLNASAANAVTGGTQTFNDNSLLNASATDAVTGGQINLRGGSVQIGTANATTNGASIDFDGGTLELNGNSTIVGKLTGSNGTISNNTSTSITLTVDSSILGDSTFGGTITDSTGRLTLQKTGEGKLTLSGTNSYDGPTMITGGTLSVSSAENLGNEFTDYNALSLNGGTLETTASFTTRRNVTLGGDGGEFLVYGGTELGITGNLVSDGADGGFTKSGEGTLVLSGSSYYQGATTIKEGTVSVSASNNLGDEYASTNGLVFEGGTLKATDSFNTMRTVLLTEDGTFQVEEGKTLTLTGVISGSGGLTKSGDGTLVLSGANTYTGSTTFNGGTVSVSASNNLGDESAATNGLVFDGGTLAATDSFDTGRSVLLTGDGTFQVVVDETLGLTGTVSGAGMLVKTGDGTLALSGSNTYTGGTTVVGGTLSGSAASIRGPIANGATVILTEDSDATLAGNVSGYKETTESTPVDGEMIKRGAGQLTLAGTSTLDWSVEAGGLTSASDRFTGDVDLAAGTNFTFDQDYDGTYDGVIAGSGNVAVTGDGTLTLSGTNTYTGSTTIDGGTVSVSASNNLGDEGAVTNGLVFDDGTLEATSGFNTGRSVLLTGDGTFQVVDGETLGLTGTVSGAGGLTKSGDGTLVLSGANTYTGSTTINGGTVSVSASNNLGDESAATNGLVLNEAYLRATDSFDTGRTVSLQGEGGGFEVADGETLGLTGTVSGAGMLVKTGDGTLALSGANTYTGGTTVMEGTLSGSAASIRGPIANGATVILTEDTDATLASNVSGYKETTESTPVEGEMIKRGAGQLTLAGTSTLDWSVEAGGLTSATDRFTGDVDLAAGTNFTFDQDYDGSYDGVIAGSGNVAVTGGGTLTLSGTNAYTGSTTIDGSTVSVSTSDNLGDEGAVTNGLVFDDGTLEATSGFNTGRSVLLTGDGTFQVVDGETLGLTGTVSGSGGLTKSGDGILVLSGTNTYTGSTTINGGTVSVSASNNLGDGSAATNGLVLEEAYLAATGSFDTGRTVSLQGEGGGFEVADGETLGLTGTVSGAGMLVKTGDGTLALSGSNTYTGGTMVAQGTLSGSAASVRGPIANAATVILTEGSDATLAGDISGAVLDPADGLVNGQMVKRGAGQLTLAGTSTLDWSVEAGGLTSATDRFTGDVDLAAGTNFTFDQSYNGTYEGVVTGSGDVLFAGGGIVLLTGDSSAYGGATAVDGALSVNGTLGGTLDVRAGGIVKGNGTIGTTTLANGATIAPGNSIGTLDVAGDLTFASGSTYEVEIEAGGASDRINVTGTAHLNGAGVQVVTLDPTVSYQDGQTYTILSAGVLDGQFASPTLASAFLDSTLAYGAGDVTLTLSVVDPTSPGGGGGSPLFPLVAGTRNQYAAATALDGLDQTAGSDSLALYNAILAADAAGARVAFDQLSGEAHASLKSGLVEDSRHVRNAALDRMAGTVGSVPVGTTGLEAWTVGYGSWGDTDGDGNAASLDRQSRGVLIGADTILADTLRVGVLAGYGHSSFDADARASSAEVDSYHVGLYGGTELGPVGLTVGAAYSWNNVETSRSVGFPGFTDRLSADYDSRTAQVFGEASYRVDLSPTTRLDPFASLAYVHLDTDAFSEEGGAAALNGQDGTTRTAFSTLGLRGATGFEAGGIALTGSGMVGWRHAFGDRTPEAQLAFNNGGAFTVGGVPVAEDAAVLELGLGAQVSPAASVSLHYSGQFGDGVSDNGITARLNVRF